MMQRLLLILPVLLLSGCGTVLDPTEWFAGPEEVQPNELVDLKNEIQPRTLWSRDIGAGADEQRLNLVPHVAGEDVFVVDAEGRVQALSRESGRPRWQVELDVPATGGPGVGEGLVLVGTGDGEIIALDAKGGELRWRTQLTSEILAVPAAAAGVVVVHSIDGKLFGLEATNGNIRWRYEREVPVLTLRGSSSPVIDGGAVFVGMAGGKLIALRLANGDVVWDLSVTVPSGRSELQRLADIDGDPIVLGGGVFVATYQGEVAAIEQRRGRLAWRRVMSAYGGMAADLDMLYVSDDTGVVWGLDIRSGAARWKQDSLLHRKLSNVAVIGDLVVVGDFEGYLHWLDRRDGRMLARTRVGSAPITTGLQVVDNVLYVQGDGGEFAAISVNRP